MKLAAMAVIGVSPKANVYSWASHGIRVTPKVL
jgi:hypothetical protein